MKTTLEKIPGLLVVILTGSFALLFSQKSHVADPRVIGLLFGILLNFVFRKQTLLKPGFFLAPRLLIPLGIICYGVDLKFKEIFLVNYTIIGHLIIAVFFVFWVALVFYKIFNLSLNTAFLLAVGTSICGASAIIILALVIEAKPEEISESVIAITIFSFLWPS